MNEYKPPARQNPDQTQHPAGSKISSLSIDRAITHSVDTLVPDLCETVLSTPVEKMSEMDSITCQDSHVFSSGRRTFQRLAAIAACFLIILTGGYGYFNYIYTDSIIDIDVNPGIELSINRQNKVTKASAVNKEAEEILDTLKLNGVEINTAASAIIGALYVNGFFNADENYLLLSVTGGFGKRQSGLIDDITRTIENSIQDDGITLHIINQSLGKHSSASQLAKKYSITLGKANLIESLLNTDSSLNPGELAGFSIDQLLTLWSGLNEEADLDNTDKIEEKESKTPSPSPSLSPAPEEDTTAPEKAPKDKDTTNAVPNKQDSDKANHTANKTSPPKKQDDRKDDKLDKDKTSSLHEKDSNVKTPGDKTWNSDDNSNDRDNDSDDNNDFRDDGTNDRDDDSDDNDDDSRDDDHDDDHDDDSDDDHDDDD